MNKFYIPVDETFYLEKPRKDLNFASFFNKNFTQDLERIEYKFLPFHLYTNYKVYVKCQILYFLYLNQHRKFTRQEITKPIINFIMKHSTFTKREELRIFCKNAVGHLASNFTILSRKNQKTKLLEYYFNIAYERLFCYGLFWNKCFIAGQLEKMTFFHINRIFKFVKVLDFIGNKAVSAQEIADSGLFGEFLNFELKILKPLIKIGLLRRFKQHRKRFYHLTAPAFHEKL